MQSDEDVLHTLRDAQRVAATQVDAAPDPRVRAAVLAAAARGVDARPRSATIAPAAARGPFSARRWPLSAAAVLIVSVMAGLVANQALRDSPERVTTVASSAPREDARVSVQSAVQSPVQPALQSDTQAAPPRVRDDAVGQPSGTAVTKDHAPAARKPAAAKRDAAQVAAAPSLEPDLPTRTPSPAPATQAAFAPPPPAAAPATMALRAKAVNNAADGAAQAVAGEAIQRRAAETFRPLVTETSARARIGRVAEPTSPEAWLERIVKMRTDGDDAAADREIDALRRRYPDFVIPANVLAPTGAR